MDENSGSVLSDSQQPIIRLLFAALGVPQLSTKDCEADDLAAWLCSLLDPDTDIILSTKDSDWFQLMGPRTLWYNPLNKQLLSFSDLSKTTIGGGPFNSIAEYVSAKALAGDSSDSIDGVPGIGMKTALKIIRDHGSIEALWQKFDNKEPLKGSKLVAVAGPDYRELYRRNVSLIDLAAAPAIPADTSILAMEPDMDTFHAICDKYGLTRISKVAADFKLDPQMKAKAISAVSPLLDPVHQSDRRAIVEGH